MIVYGSNRKRYVLSTLSVGQDQSGASYYAEHEPDILVKIYHPQFRNPSTERDVIDAINGVRSMLNEIPLDVVYLNGRFAGYIYQKSSPNTPPTYYPAQSVQPIQRSPRNAPDGTLVLICMGIGIALSALVYFVLFNLLKGTFGDDYIFWNFKGIPMIIGGWIVLLLVLLKSRQEIGSTIGFSALGFIIGSILVFLFICALVYMFSVAAAIMKLLLPTIIVVIIIVLLLKSLLKR